MSETPSDLHLFLEQLASSAPAPGGGGASALVGAVGAALGGMVGSLSVSKLPEPARSETEGLIRRCGELREELYACVDGDAEAFRPLAEAYRIPRDDPSRAERLESCLLRAASIPQRVMGLCEEALGLLAGLAERSTELAVSDAAVGAACCLAALSGAAVNVRVNTRYLRDRERADAINAETNARLARCRSAAESLFASVWDRLG